MKRSQFWLVLTAFVAFVLLPTLAWAAPRSGGSFGGRRGFRTTPRTPSGQTAPAPRGGGGPSFIFFPGFGWGWGGYGAGGGSLLGTLAVVALVGVGTVMVLRAVRRAQARSAGWQQGQYGQDDERDTDVLPARAYVHKVQLGLGRSARGLQQRLQQFAAEGDTSTEHGIAELVHQTALELLREKDSIRYASVETSGPMSLTNGETKLNATALAERSRFQVERVRGAEGQVRRSEAQPHVSDDVLEYLLVTLVLATRTPFERTPKVAEREDVERMLAELGGLPAETVLGLEVVWTPADTDDALTKNDLLTAYPELRQL